MTHVSAHLAEETCGHEFSQLPCIWIESTPELMTEIQVNGFPRNQFVVQRFLSSSSCKVQNLNSFGSEVALSSILEVRDKLDVAKHLKLETSILDEFSASDLLVLDVQGAENY